MTAHSKLSFRLSHSQILLHNAMAPSRIDSSPEPEFENDSGKPTVYLIDEYHPEAVKHCHTLFNVIGPKDPEVKNWRQNARYILVKGSVVSADDIAQAKSLRAIGKQGVGIDKIDAAACKAAGVKIFNTPGVNATAVAELVLALTMSVAREIRPITLKQGAGEVVPKSTCSGLILTGRSIGLIGMGNISRRVAEIFHGAFGSHIIAYDPFLPKDAWSDLPHQRATTVDEVLVADVVSIHVPLVKDTTNLISYAQLERMQPTSILINAARGGIVNEADLARALHEGLIWGAGLDCHMQEPPTKETYAKLWSSPRVVSTPHIGAATDQTQMETAKAAVDFLFEFAKQQ
jgi:phosphoglycerate dehydrogenase-like enzyme